MEGAIGSAAPGSGAKKEEDNPLFDGVVVDDGSQDWWSLARNDVMGLGSWFDRALSIKLPREYESGGR